MAEGNRTTSFRRNERLDQLLHELNGLLSSCQEVVNQRYDRPRFPLLLLMGAPRSGTTLFMQWLAESQQWGYPTNVIARFFSAPYVGARVQQILIENDYHEQISDFKKTVPYTSTLGLTQGALAPHGFTFFWRRFFPLDPEADIVLPDALGRVDVNKLNRELATLEAALEKPLAMKAMLLNCNIPFLDTTFEKVLFVNLKRDPAYVTQSLLEGRQKYFGSEKLWYSFKPPEYKWLKKLEPVSQVAGQVYFIRKAVEEGIAQVDESRKLAVDYEQFCKAPGAIWEALREKMNGQGYLMDGDYTGPKQFDAANTVRMPLERWAQIQQALDEVPRMQFDEEG